MRDCIIFLIITIVFGGCQYRDFVYTCEQIKPSVVKIIAVSTDGKETELYGTGFFVNDKGLVATANHVIETLEKSKTNWYVFIGWYDSSKEVFNIEPVDILRRDSLRDIILLKTQKRIPSIPVSIKYKFDSIKVGDDIGICGFPLGKGSGKEHSFFKGIISSKKHTDKNVAVFQIDSMNLKGNSGAPVFMASTGEVIGVFKGSYDKYQESLPLAVSIDYLKELIDNN